MRRSQNLFPVALGCMIVAVPMFLFHYFSSKKEIFATQNEPIVAYWEKGNLFKGAFKEPFEVMYFIFKNGDFYSVTTHTDYAILISPFYVREFFKEQGKKIEDIILIVHNHIISRRPSNNDGDIYFLRTLVKYGFKGSFGIYTHASGLVFPYEER